MTAAWSSLLNPNAPENRKTDWEILFPDGKRRMLSLKERSAGFASIIKDGGDDPDCTHGAEIYARIRHAQPHEAAEQDYLLEAGNALILLRAVEGIGLCTRPGLDCDKGRWAINAGPRRMMVDNFMALGLASGCFLAEIGVKNGELLAQKTLNARLGVLGGISILGTTGIVRPFSHEAYLETIRICMRSTRLLGFDDIVLCTGGRTESTARKQLPGIPETSFVCMGDFIGESLRSALEQNMKRVTIACMPGKLCKYAAGFDNTHAHKVDQDMNLFLKTLETIHMPDQTTRQTISRCTSVRQALEQITADCRLPLLAALCRQAFAQFSLKAPGIAFRLLVCDFDGSLLLDISSNSSPCLL